MKASEIKALRHALGLSVPQFAGVCGVSLSTVYRWEADRRKGGPAIDPLQRMVLLRLQEALTRSPTGKLAQLGKALELALAHGNALEAIACLVEATRRAR